MYFSFTFIPNCSIEFMRRLDLKDEGGVDWEWKKKKENGETKLPGK